MSDWAAIFQDFDLSISVSQGAINRALTTLAVQGLVPNSLTITRTVQKDARSYQYEVQSDVNGAAPASAKVTAAAAA
jgi:hypothetical protein